MQVLNTKTARPAHVVLSKENGVVIIKGYKLLWAVARGLIIRASLESDVLSH